MKFQGAIVKEQGVTFAIVIIKHHIFQNSFSRDETRQNLSALFPGMPVILMAQDSRGTPTYYGRNDIVKFLANVSIERITWKEFSNN